jgi:hypothetical protein
MPDFDKFMEKVDSLLLSKFGLTSNSISDAPWYDYCMDELEVEAACAYALYDYNDVDFGVLETIGLADYI